MMVQLSNLAYRRLRDFWLRLSLGDCVADWNLVSPQELLFTDASEFGYGAHLSRIS